MRNDTRLGHPAPHGNPMRQRPVRKQRRILHAVFEGLEERQLLSGLPPVANDNSFRTPVNVPLVKVVPGVLANDTGADGDALSAILVDGPSHGSLTLNSDGSFTYTPEEDFNGPDSFTYRASDGTDQSNLATVSIMVNSVPVANNDNFMTDEDVPLSIAMPGVLANDTDADGNALSAAFVDGPSHGGLTLNSDGSFAYTPDANFNGADVFTYRVSDGVEQSNVATATITVNPVNDAPVANGDSFRTPVNAPLVVSAPGVLANDTDLDGDTLSAVLVDNPSHGALAMNPDGSFTYTPDEDFNGPDSFTYRASDGTEQSDLATVGLMVNAVPVANNDGFTTDEDTPLTIAAPGVLANDSDADGSALSAVLVAGPSHGGLTLNPDGSFAYTPDANFNGTDVFTYNASDGVEQSNLGTVTITVNPVEDAPVASDNSFRTPVNVPLTIASPGVLANDTDADGDTLSAILVNGPTYGSLTLGPDGSFTYTPNAGFNGADSFTYQASDGTDQSNLATVSLVVNSAPVANDDGFTTDEDTPLTIAVPGVLANDTDADGTALSAVLVDSPSHGGLTLNPDGSFAYTPDANFNGTDVFTYRVSDGVELSNVATATITVNPVNDIPVANNDSYVINEDTPLNIAASGVLANDTDADGDTLSAVLVDAPSNGALTLNPDGSFDYTPAANFHGTDTFTYRASDGTDQSNLATVTIVINSVNDAPVAGNDAYSILSGHTLTVAAPGVLANDTDVDGDTLTAAVFSSPANGVLSLNADGSFTYTPNAGFSGTDTFAYKVFDVASASATGTATISVLNQAPKASSHFVATRKPGAGVAVNLWQHVSDPDDHELTFRILTKPAHGKVTLANGIVRYTPAARYYGDDSFSYQVSDPHGATATGTIPIQVSGAGLVPSPSDPEIKDLIVFGTNQADTIQLTPGSSSGSVKVVLNGVTQGVFNPTGQIIVKGLDGDDVITAIGLGARVLMYGGRGQNQLTSR